MLSANQLTVADTTRTYRLGTVSQLRYPEMVIYIYLSTSMIFTHFATGNLTGNPEVFIKGFITHQTENNSILVKNLPCGK